ncbi:hypothetical protein BC351_33260 [Paenibacillus ferrarius]|uniref:Copper amine oxidase-like N-terminal domain-containing protein n=1 Tax=Paenibacillus ferrarius TaxID=1469647 RepID=A0A1V4HEK9_9BACL|nr:hypothetical protein [Paenibacillus ferrarius]OPH52202.1 hypothetical protein BC351_33260 [Paenibacillus ferrarius]
MKKFISGLVLGIGISACSVAFASDSMQAFLFPSKVTFHNNGVSKEITFSSDDPVINFNNKAYIPLRLFSEALDAKVNYALPSASSDGKNVIDIYFNKDNGVILEDVDGFISITNLESVPSLGEVSLSALLHVNKNVDGKIIEIHALNSSKKIIGSSAEISIEGNSALKVGDTRKITAPIVSKETPSSFEVLVKDMWGLTLMDSYSDGMISGIAGVSFGPPSVDLNKKALISSLQFKNPSDKDINIEPLAIEYQINKVNGETKEAIKSYKLPILKGNVPKESWYQAAVPAWDLKDQNGKVISPGKYEVKIIVPSTLKYTAEGSSAAETIGNLAKFTHWEVEITQDQINKITT